MTYAVISPMRAGSTFLFRMLRDFSDDYDIKLNDEFFNTIYPGWSSIDDGTRLRSSDRDYFPLEEETEYRINLLKKYDCKNTVKVISTHLSSKIINFLTNNYNIVIIDRQNKYEQYLSYIIAYNTDVWNKLGPEEHIVEPFECPLEYALNFLKIEKKWQEDKAYILENTPAILLDYEKLIDNPVFYLQSRGINTRPFSEYYKPIYKLNFKFPKEYYITNIDLIREIYNQHERLL